MRKTRRRRKSIIVRRRHPKPQLKSTSLFSFSCILSTKYPQGRIAPTTAPTNPSNQWDNSLTVSATIINLEDEPPLKKDQATSMTELPRTPERKKRKSAAYYCCRVYRYKAYLAALIGLALLIMIAIMIVAVLYRSKGATTTTTTTSTTTTYTSATTSTSTTSTSTSTSTTTTSSTGTTSTATSTTSETTTTTTTDTSTTTACYFGGDYVNLVEGGQRQISSLKAGDRVWTLSSDGQRLIEDEIMCIPHSGPTTFTEFYTFITLEGQTISLTGAHYIVVGSNDEKRMKTIRASSVTLEDRLIMFGRSVGLQRIVYSNRVGYYSPITLSGYLLVNNLSTSVYVDFLSGTHEFFYQLTAPARFYYYATRWLFGNAYVPFASSVNDEIHPISLFVLDNYEQIRLIFNTFPFITPMLSIMVIIHLIQRVFPFKILFSETSNNF